MPSKLKIGSFREQLDLFATPKGKGRPRTRSRDLFDRVVRSEPLDRNAEGKRQAAIVEYVRMVAPHIIIYHVPNGGYRTRAEAARLKWIGVLAGVLDLVLLSPGGRSAHWECKKPKGRLSPDQRDYIARLEGLGHSWAIVLSIDDARRELARLGVETREAAGTPTGRLHDRSRRPILPAPIDGIV